MPESLTEWAWADKPGGASKEMIELLLEAERRVSKQSPFYMAKYVMGKGNRRQGKLWGWNHHHINLSHLLWWVWKTREDRPSGTQTYCEWARGSRKSTIHLAAVLCMMTDDPNETFLWDGDVAKKAAQKVYLVKEMFEDEYFVRLFGDLRGEKWKKDEMVLRRTVKTADPTLMVSGLDSSSTGLHPGVIVSDDQQTDDNADSPELNEEVKTKHRLYEGIQRGKWCPIIMSDGTRWGFRDKGHMLQEMWEEERRKGVKPSIFITRIAGFKRTEDGKTFNWKVAEFAECGMTLEAMRRMRMTFRPMLFSYNILLEPFSAEDAPFKKEFIQHHEKDITDLKNEGASFWLLVDPAGDGKNAQGKTWKGADFNALVVSAITPTGEMYVMETVNKHLKPTELFAEIVRLNESYPELRVMVETYFQQFKLASWLRNHATENLIQIAWAKFKMDKRAKAARIDGLEPMFRARKIFWRKEHVELEDQVLTWTGKEEEGRHDDLLDGLSHTYHQAVIPNVDSETLWFMDDDWTARPEYAEITAKKGKAPDYMTVMVKRAEEVERQARITGRRGRFSFPAMR